MKRTTMDMGMKCLTPSSANPFFPDIRIALFVAASFLFLTISNTQAETETIAGIEWSYNIDNGTASVEGASPATGILSIPSQLGGCSVTKIESWAFSNCDKLTSLTIPQSITYIGSYAFYGCCGLSSLNIPASVTYIGSRAFGDCDGLTSFRFPASVTSIGYNMFAGCDKLTSVIILDSVTNIAEEAFGECQKLTEITVSGGNSCYSSKDGVLFSKSGDILVCCPEGKTGVYVVPDKVTRIENRAFNNCAGLTSLKFPDSLSNIGYETFGDCLGLAEITVSSGNEHFASDGDVLFTKSRDMLVWCSGWKTGAYTIPTSVKCTKEFAFEWCTKLTAVTIPSSVTNIGDGTFFGCNQLKEAIIPTSVQSVGRAAFMGCSGLKTISISDSLRNIGNQTFQECSSLTDVTIPNSVTNIGDSAFYKCSSLNSITIGKKVKCIGDEAFYKCTNLPTLTLPDSVKCIGSWAVKDCTALTTLSVPGSWKGTSKLAEAKVPSTCTVIYRDGTEIDVPQETKSTPVPVPYTWLKTHAATILASYGNDFESTAAALAANGRPVWECYVADVSPMDAKANFKVELAWKDGTWVAKPVPNLGTNRTYTVEGSERLGTEAAWGEVTDNSRFFRVKVTVPTEVKP